MPGSQLLAGAQGSRSVQARLRAIAESFLGSSDLAEIYEDFCGGSGGFPGVFRTSAAGSGVSIAIDGVNKPGGVALLQPGTSGTGSIAQLDSFAGDYNFIANVRTSRFVIAALLNTSGMGADVNCRWAVGISNAGSEIAGTMLHGPTSVTNWQCVTLNGAGALVNRVDTGVTMAESTSLSLVPFASSPVFFGSNGVNFWSRIGWSGAWVQGPSVLGIGAGFTPGIIVMRGFPAGGVTNYPIRCDSLAGWTVR